jgi:DNA topoisomerase VI subunit B
MEQHEAQRDPMTDAVQTLRDVQARLIVLEGKDKEIDRQVNMNEFILKDGTKSIGLELQMLKDEMAEMKAKLSMITKNMKLIAKEFRMIAKKDEMRKVEKSIETVMAAKLVSRVEADKMIQGSEGL